LKGEFYITGVLVEKYPLKCKQIQQLGHIMGGHGYDHEDFSKLSYKKSEALILKTKKLFIKNGIKMSRWRFPGLNFRNSQLKVLAQNNISDSSLRFNNYKRRLYRCL